LFFFNLNIFLYFKFFIKNWNLHKYFTVLVLFLFFVKIFLTSFSLLLNYFLWIFFYLNILNYDQNLNFTTILFVVVLYVTLTIKQLLKHTCNSLSFLNDIFLFFWFKNLRLSNFFKIIHFLLFNFFLLTVISWKFDILDFDNSSIFSNSVHDNFCYKMSKVFNLNTIFIEYQYPILFEFNFLSQWSVNNFLSYFATPLFSLVMSNNNFFNFIFLNSDFNFMYLLSESIFNSLLFFFSLLLIFAIILSIIRKIKNFK